MKSCRIVFVCIFTFQAVIALDLNFEKKVEEEFGPSNDPYFPYKFGTGAGNREELNIDRVLVDESAKDIWEEGWQGSWQRWVSIKLPDMQILARASRDRVIILRTGVDTSSPHSLFLHHASEEITGGFGPIELIVHWNRTTKSKQPFLLVSSKDYGVQSLSWFKILPEKLEELKISGSPTIGKTVGLKWVKEDDTELLVMATHDKSGRTKIEIFKYSLDDSKNPHMFQTTCLEKTYVNALVSGMEAVITNDRVFVAVVVEETVQVYTYDLLDEEDGPLLTQSLQAPGVTHIQAFYLASRVYFAFNGQRADFLRIPNEGYSLEPMLHQYRSVDEWLLLPVSTYREDVVAFARDGKEIDAILWRGTDGFAAVPQPPCYLVDPSLNVISELSEDLGCLSNGNWTTAAVLTVAHVPAVLMQRSRADNSLALFYIETRLQLSDSPGSKLRKLYASAVQLHERLKNLGSEIENTDWLQMRSHEPTHVLDGWSDLNLLNSCLAELDKEIDNLKRVVEEKKANNVKVAMYLDHGKLSGNSSGKVFNKSVEMNFSGNLVSGPLRSREENEVLLVAKVTLNNSRHYTVHTTLKLGSFDIRKEGEVTEHVPVASLSQDDDFPLVIAQDPSSPSPELLSTPVFKSSLRMDRPLHESVARSLHEN